MGAKCASAHMVRSITKIQINSANSDLILQAHTGKQQETTGKTPPLVKYGHIFHLTPSIMHIHVMYVDTHLLNMSLQY